jgi:hypothetical protein
MSTELEDITRQALEQGQDPAVARAEEMAIRQQIRDDALADAARNGRLRISRKDLDRAYEGHAAERDELFRIVKARRDAEAERAERQQQHEQLGEMTRTVLKEWDDERREQAKAEARKRLAMEQQP